MKHLLFNHKVYTKIIVIFAIINALVVVSIESVETSYYNGLQEQQQNRPRITTQTQVENQTDQLHYAKFKFAISLLDALQKDKPNEHIFYSPHSVFRALLLCYFGAAGETEKELKHVLGLDWAKNKNDVADWYKMDKEKWYKRKNQLRNQSIEFMSADKLYMADHIEVSDSVKQALNGSIEQLDFNDNVNLSTKYINQFIQETTKDQIKELVKPDMMWASETVIVNAAYFNGHWFYPFLQETLISIQRTIENNTGYGFVDHLKSQVLRMPYKGDNQTVAMYVLLPEHNSTVFELLEKLTPKILDDIFNGVYFGIENVCVRFTTFSLDKVEFEANLIPAMQRMGLQKSFGNNTNYSSFYADNEAHKSFKIDFKHKAKFGMDEALKPEPRTGRRGSRAKVPNGLLGKVVQSTVFECNRSFMFIIHDQNMKEILFVGIFRGKKSYLLASKNNRNSN